MFVIVSIIILRVFYKVVVKIFKSKQKKVDFYIYDI